MKILNFGSINMDHVYEVPHFVQPGETLACTTYHTFIGGKGCNQSVALASAGTPVFHAGCIGTDGLWIKDQLNQWGVNTEFVKVAETATGQAIIQVNEWGENAIILHGGANQTIASNQIDDTLTHFEKGDILLLQNEINLMPEIIEKAARKGMIIFFNPAPMTDKVRKYPLDEVNVFIVNELEGKGLTNQTDVEGIIEVMIQKFPRASTLLTLGERGAIYVGQGARYQVAAERVQPIDTTAAGDTFIGYFLNAWINKMPANDALKVANRAAAACVSRKGGAISIPDREELDS